jgi:hypothetical protein
MVLVTLEELLEHCKQDAGVDDAELTRCGNAAEKMAAQFTNRDIFPDQTAFDAALDGVSSSMAAAHVAYDAAIAAADALSDSRDQAYATERAKKDLRAVTARNSRILSGMIVNDAIKAAILLIAAHLYRNREEVAVGATVATVQIPMGAARILDSYEAIDGML